MSFLELWDCFIEVRENWNDNKQLLEAYLEVLKFRSEIELSYSKKLDKLCTYPFFRLGKNTYEPAIEKFKSFFMTKLLGCKNFLTDLQNEIIQPLKDLLLAQELKIRDKIESGKKLEQERKKMIKSYENSKEKYWKSCRDTLLNTKSKQEYLTKEEHNFESYCRNIDQLNRFNVVFVEDMGKNLAVFQICEEERLKHLRESFRKLFVQEDALTKCTYTELEQLPLAINVFNPITELCKFIDDIKTGESAKMQTFESSPYGTSYKFPDQKATLEDSLLLKINIKCWEGFSISEEEHKSFLDLIPKAEYRNSWLYYLNERRIKSQFIMPINGFNAMSKLMLEFLDVISVDNDETSAKLTIILSQTFYYEKAGEKIFLHVMLVNHKIWFSETIWNNMIEDGIKKEMENYSQFCTDETSEEHKERMIAIIMSQLSSYIHIMKSFQLSSEFMIQIVTTLTSKYKMNLDMFLELIG